MFRICPKALYAGTVCPVAPDIVFYSSREALAVEH
jgi:hypothetical protein